MAGSSVSASQNSSQNQSQSQSTTSVLDYSERAFQDAIAQYAGQVGQNVYNWAQDAYSRTSDLTNANIDNYLNTSASATNQANNYLGAYNSYAIPGIESQYAAAREYASPERIARDEGAAESEQAQGTQAALDNHKRDLQSYGIDPSSGRYAELDEASRVQGAAAAVGAAETARRADVKTGQDLLNQAITNSQAWMGAATNEQNTALQGYAGSENAGLANANTGVALQGAANQYLNTAYHNPLTGTNSTSSGSGSSQGTSGSNSVTTDPPTSSGNTGSTGGNGSGSNGSENNAVQQGTGTRTGSSSSKTLW